MCISSYIIYKGWIISHVLNPIFVISDTENKTGVVSHSWTTSASICIYFLSFPFQIFMHHLIAHNTLFLRSFYEILHIPSSRLRRIAYPIRAAKPPWLVPISVDGPTGKYTKTPTSISTLFSSFLTWMNCVPLVFSTVNSIRYIWEKTCRTYFSIRNLLDTNASTKISTGKWLIQYISQYFCSKHMNWKKLKFKKSSINSTAYNDGVCTDATHN